jgi:hypothetical protein
MIGFTILRRNQMIEKIKSFFGFANKKEVENGKLWHCTKCKLIFLSESTGKKHHCVEQEIENGKV